MTKLHQLADLGQAVWLDYIRRSFTESGELHKLVEMGLRGVTSNPTIFEKAIGNSSDYDEDFKRLVKAGKTANEIFLELAVEDIRAAADELRPVYEQTGGTDGFVSLEVNPMLANDTEATIAEARHLWQWVDRPNLMIKIPATLAGLPAISQAISEGINVNVTLIFSLGRYGEVMAAFIRGMELRQRAGNPIDHIASVASFFVSRIDTKVDRRLNDLLDHELSGAEAELARSLLGQAAVASAKMAYRQFKTVFLGEGDSGNGKFADLQEHGAHLQRPLWASTSTKNPNYSDIKYVQELIGPHTVNTMPQETMEAFLDHGEVRLTLEEDINKARFVLQSLEDLGISMQQVTQELEVEGVEKFSKSYEELLETIEKRREEMRPSRKRMGAVLHSQDNVIDTAQALDEMARENIIKRIWDHDNTVWKQDPTEITNRLGWLDIANEMSQRISRIRAFVQSIRDDGYTHVLLLGMGGSSLAPDLFGRVFDNAEKGLDVQVLDSTDPAMVREYSEKLDPSRTLYIVSTKSGTTTETLSFFKYFYNQTTEVVGKKEAGAHFAAVTDPGSSLIEKAEDHNFREIFENNPNIGGRYSALSYFGLVPAALRGLDLARLLDRAEQMRRACGPDVPPEENPAAKLGVILGESAKAGRDKLTFVLSPEVAAFADWVEQLIAESTGKEGKGILPVAHEPLGPPAAYGDDRLFVHIYLEGDTNHQTELQDLADSGFPVIHLPMQDRYDLGSQFFLWELATAVAGYRLGINPFDQPNVESAKKRAREMTQAYKEKGQLPAATPVLSEDGIEVYGPERVEGEVASWTLEGDTPGEALAEFLSQARNGDYIALQAFIYPQEETTQALQALRTELRDRYHLATTLGYGPRFLHSTGQLHKGDAGNGLFLQFTAEHLVDVEIPDQAGKDNSSMTFGVLELAQALGDRRALLDAGRRVIRFHFAGNAPEKIRRLKQAVEARSPREEPGD